MSDRGWHSEHFAHAWKADAERRNHMLWPATQRMLAEARLGFGSRVLDVGAGTGDMALLASDKVGPHGAVVAIDKSPTMLAALRATVRSTGVINTSVEEMDVETLRLPETSFDIALARLVLMLVDPSRALMEIRRVLRSGGRLSAMVWGPARHNPYETIVMNAARAQGGWGKYDITLAREMSIGEPDAYRDALVRASYREIKIFTMRCVREFDSHAAAYRSVVDSVIVSEPIRALPKERRVAALVDVRDQLKQFVGKDQRVEIPAEVLVLVGRR
jgi:ubiquinone/menaquinone biosynthesis C-methylase UbiE